MTGPEDIDLDEWPQDQTTDHIGGAEPVVGVPAGLLGQAIELLDLCDELCNRPGTRHLDAHISAVINRYQRANVVTLRWFHVGLGATAHGLQELLDDTGVIVEPTLRGRPAPHYR
jgi:hypothetical protein